MRYLMIAASCVALAGCNFGAKICTSETAATDCGGGECVAGFCVSEDAGRTGGGLGGGGGTGGGGGVTGGGGGVTGGGGGTMGDCPLRCQAWQSCQPGDGGTCRNVVVEITSPMQGDIFGGGSSTRLIAQVTDWDGGVWAGTPLPVTVTTGVIGPSVLERTDAGFMGDFGFPQVTAMHTLTVGWAEVSDSVQVQSRVCTAMCPDFQECVPNQGTGTCGDLGLTLTWDAPAEDFKYAPSTAVPLRLSVTRADGGAFTKPVPFTVSGGNAGVLTLDAGAWVAAIQSGTTDTRRTLEAGWEDGGPVHPLRTFVVDALPASLALVVTSDGGAYQRDAVIPAVLRSSEFIADAGVTLAGVPMARTATTSCPNYGMVPDASGCFLLDFSEPVLNGFDGGFATTLSATDLYGNSGSNAGPLLQVTRLRWQVELLGVEAVYAAPALGSDGTLYVGTVSGPTAGSVFAVTPSGLTKSGWPSTGIAVGAIQGLAVADPGSGDVVYFSANTTGAAVIGALASATGVFLNMGNQCNSSGLTFSGIGLVNAVGGQRAVGAMGVLGTLPDGGTNVARMCAFSASMTTSYINGVDTANLNAPAVPALDSATNVAIDNTKAYFVGRGGRVFNATLNSNWTAPVEARVMAANAGALFTGTALYRDETNSKWDLVLGGGLLPGNLHFLEGTTLRSIDLSGALVGQPSLMPEPATGSTYVYAGVDSAGLRRFDTAAVAGAALPTSTLATTAPVLGTGGLGYVVDGAGQISAFRTQNAPVAIWTAAPFPPASFVAAAPTLDCVRSGGVGITGARVGVLYAVSTNRWVTAVLVDSPKLNNDTIPGTGEASWPKYQRTAGNAGNVDPAFPLNPGCP